MFDISMMKQKSNIGFDELRIIRRYSKSFSESTMSFDGSMLLAGVKMG